MEFIKVKNFASVITGGTPSTKKKEYWNGGNIPWLNSGELNQNIVKTTRNYITELGLQKSAAKLMPKDTVLIALTGATTGVVGYLTFESTANQSVTGILPSDKHIPKYLFYYLKSIRPKVLHDAYGGAQPHISQGYVKELKIPLPPLDQQKQIAKILDTADAYRQKTKALIEKYDALTQSLFLEMFGSLKGEKSSLNEIAILNPKKSEIKELDKEMKVSFIPMSNVSETGEVNLRNERKIKDVWSGFTYFAENDVVFAKITPCMENGKGAIMKKLLNSIGFGTTEFHVIRPIQKITTPEWLYYLTVSKFFRKLAEKNMRGSAGQKRVPTDFFKRFKIVCPPIELQYQFSERVQAIELQKLLAQQELEKAESLFSCLLQRAFKGELTN